MRLRNIAIICLMALLLPGCGMDGGLSDDFEFPRQTEEKKETVTFGRVPAETVISLLKDHAPLIELLESKLEINIQFVFASEYNQILEGMSREQYDFVFLGPFSYVQSKTTSDYEAVIRPERFGNDWYRGIIFTHRQWDITELDQLVGESLAFVDENSASGFLFPKALLIEEGVEPTRDNFRSIAFLGRHDRVVRAVYRGEYTAGATFKDARMSAGLPEDVDVDETLPILAETRKIPTSPIAVSKKFKKNNPDVVREIVECLIELEELEGGPQALDALGIDRYIKSEPGDYEEVVQVRNTLNLLNDKTLDIQ